MQTIEQRIEDFAEEFMDCDARERLEVLVDYSYDLEDLPEGYNIGPENDQWRVKECMTPVHLWVELDEQSKTVIHAHVPENAPTVKGFIAVLVKIFSGASVDEVLQTPPDLLDRLGLVEALGMQRKQGMNGAVQFIRLRATQAIGS